MPATDQGVTPLNASPQPLVNKGDSDDVALALAGDELAFERIYRRHSGRIYNLAWRMLGEDHAAEGTQQVFVRAWYKLKTFRGESQFGTWLHRLAVNVFLGERGTLGTARSRFHEDDSPLEFVAGGSVHSSPEFELDFEKAVARLPDGYRKVFVLHDVEGYTHEEIGKALGIAAGSSKAALHRARNALRKYLDR